MDYSWIKPGVKAECFGLERDINANGRIITISEINIKLRALSGEIVVGVRSEDVGTISNNNIKPFNPPNWEGIIDGSVECKDENTVYRDQKALEALTDEWK